MPSYTVLVLLLLLLASRASCFFLFKNSIRKMVYVGIMATAGDVEHRFKALGHRCIPHFLPAIEELAVVPRYFQALHCAILSMWINATTGLKTPQVFVPVCCVSHSIWVAEVEQAKLWCVEAPMGTAVIIQLLHCTLMVY